jgi:hypothetical protein
MPESEENKYHVVLVQPPAPPNDLGEMTETELYGYLGGKLGEAATEAVRYKLEELGAATAEFEAPCGLKTRVEIRRLGSKRLLA